MGQQIPGYDEEHKAALVVFARENGNIRFRGIGEVCNEFLELVMELAQEAGIHNTSVVAKNAFRKMPEGDIFRVFSDAFDSDEIQSYAE